MKIQDIGFVLVLSILLFFRVPRLFVLSGLICYLVAIPLFASWVFFTAERLVWYGSCFLLLSLLIPKRSASTVK